MSGVLHFSSRQYVALYSYPYLFYGLTCSSFVIFSPSFPLYFFRFISTTTFFPPLFSFFLSLLNVGSQLPPYTCDWQRRYILLGRLAQPLRQNIVRRYRRKRLAKYQLLSIICGMRIFMIRDAMLYVISATVQVDDLGALQCLEQ